MTVRVDMNGLLAQTAGADGVTGEELDALTPELERVRRELAELRAAGELAVADLPYRRADLQSINPLLTQHPLARQVQRYVLLTTLARYDSALAPTPGATPHSCRYAGRCVVMNTSWKPQAKNAIIMKT